MATATYKSPYETSQDDLVRYPEEVRSAFLKTGGLTFRDGTHHTAEQIWDWVNFEGPRRYPNLFAEGRLFGPSRDLALLSGIKRQFLTSTLYVRMEKATREGIPTVFVQGGQDHDPYYAAGGIPLRPAHVSAWALNRKEGQSFGQADLQRQQHRQKSMQQLTEDACQTAGYGIIQSGDVPITLISPYLANRCSDIAYGVEAHRHGPVKLDLGLVDIPVNDQKDKEWAVEYTAKSLRRLVELVARHSGRKVTDEHLWEEFKLHNKKRRLAREYLHLWWNARVPPTNSQDHGGIWGLGNESHGDPVASLQILEESVAEVKQRIQDGVKGAGLQDDPIRLLILGSCVNTNLKHTDDVGGVIAAKDDGYSEIFHDVAEDGNDPYRALAETVLAYPYEQPTEKRGEWTAQLAKDSKAAGAIFMHQWGCNYQSGIARLLVDAVQDKADIPAIVIERTFAESSTGHEQVNGRVETFLEILRQTQ